MIANPFSGPPPKRVPLPRAPLVSVLGQVRFAEVSSIVKKDFIADFQERIRQRYPIQDFVPDRVLELTQHGVGFEASTKEEARWQFMDVERVWRISLTPTFVTLETRHYESRPDFVDRLEEIVSALQETIRPTHRERIGVRYVDRVIGTELDQLQNLVRSELTGFAASGLRSRIQRSMHEVLCDVDEGQLLARWGLMPANTTHDLAMAPPVQESGWVLDIDVFGTPSDGLEPFDSAEIKQAALSCASRCYAFFRWATQPAFLKAYGGQE